MDRRRPEGCEPNPPSPLPLKPLIPSLTPAQVGRCLAREGCASPALTPTLAARASTRTARATRAESGTRAVPNRASRLQHGPWAPSAESGKKWGKTSKSKDRGLPTLFAAGPGRRRRGTERGTRAVQTEPRTFNTSPGRRVGKSVGKSGTIRIGGLPTLFAQPGRGARRTSRRGAPPARHTPRHPPSRAADRGARFEY